MSDDSEYEEEDIGRSEDDEEEESEEEVVEVKKPPPKRKQLAAPRQQAAPKNARKKINDNDDDDDDDDDDDEPKEARMTDRGGYLHTQNSRLKISMANRGNTPWNKGGQRSEADKARIKAGVRARNRAVLLEKLETLGLTEDEWIQSKKDIKVMRERLRLAKIRRNGKKKGTRKRKNAVADSVKDLSLLVQKGVGNDDEEEWIDADAAAMLSTAPTSSQSPTLQAASMASLPPLRPLVPTVVAATTPPPQGLAAFPPSALPPDSLLPPVAPLPSVAPPAEPPRVKRRVIYVPAEDPTLRTVFPREISFRKDAENMSSIQCPMGGAGGLVCCKACHERYSTHLGRTCRELESQRLANVGTELQELIEIAGAAKSRLIDSVQKMSRRSAAAQTTLNSGGTSTRL